MRAVLVVGVIGGLRQLPRILETAFCRRDARQQRARIVAARVNVGQLHRRFDGVNLVVLVVDRKVAVKAHPLAMPSQDTRADGVKRPHGDGLAGTHHQAVQALPHLPRRLVGERHREDAPGGDAALFHQVGDTVGDNPRLA